MPLLAPALLLAALLAGAVYQRLIYWMPLQIMQIFLPMLLGFGVGLAADWVLKEAPCRNPVAGIGLIGLAALGAWAASWAMAFLLDLRESAPEALLGDLVRSVDVAGFTDWVTWRYESGWQDDRGRTTQGFLVAVNWVLEYGAIAVCALLVGRKALLLPFCEACQRWPKERIVSCVGYRAQDVQASLEGGDLGALLALRSRSDGPQDHYISLVRHACEGCGGNAHLNVEAVHLVRTRKGPTEKRRTLLRNAVLEGESAQRFEQRLAEFDAANLSPAT